MSYTSSPSPWSQKLGYFISWNSSNLSIQKWHTGNIGRSHREGGKQASSGVSCKTLRAILASNHQAKPSQILALDRYLSGGFVTYLLLQSSFKTALPVDAKHAAHSAKAFPTAGSHFIKTCLFIIVFVTLEGYYLTSQLMPMMGLS